MGISTLWDLNKLGLKFSYDHSDYVELTGGLGQPDRTEEIFSFSAGYTLRPFMVLGLELGGGLLNTANAGTNTAYPDATQWNVGCFLQTQAGEHVALTVHAGYTVLTPEANGAPTPTEDFHGFYAALAVTHHLNRFVDYQLSAGRSVNSTLLAGSVDLYNAGLSANWESYFQELSLTTAFLYQHTGRSSLS